MKTPFNQPDVLTLERLIGHHALEVWNKLCCFVESRYDMEKSWNTGGKRWTYEYKYRRGGKTLCAIYAKENVIGFMVILGKEERNKFEEQRYLFSSGTQRIYDEAITYHDGKWLMFEPKDTSDFSDYERLLYIKRMPNRK